MLVEVCNIVRVAGQRQSLSPRRTVRLKKINAGHGARDVCAERGCIDLNDLLAFCTRQRQRGFTSQPHGLRGLHQGVRLRQIAVINADVADDVDGVIAQGLQHGVVILFNDAGEHPAWIEAAPVVPAGQPHAADGMYGTDDIIILILGQPCMQRCSSFRVVGGFYAFVDGQAVCLCGLDFGAIRIGLKHPRIIAGKERIVNKFGIGVHMVRKADTLAAPLPHSIQINGHRAMGVPAGMGCMHVDIHPIKIGHVEIPFYAVVRAYRMSPEQTLRRTHRRPCGEGVCISAGPAKPRVLCPMDKIDNDSQANEVIQPPDKSLD